MPRGPLSSCLDRCFVRVLLCKANTSNALATREEFATVFSERAPIGIQDNVYQAIGSGRRYVVYMYFLRTGYFEIYFCLLPVGWSLAALVSEVRSLDRLFFVKQKNSSATTRGTCRASSVRSVYYEGAREKMSLLSVLRNRR